MLVRNSANLYLVVVLAAQPGSAVRIVLFFPDRHDLLDPLDRVPASLERSVAVSRGNTDDDARLPDRERAYAMDDGHMVDSPAFSNLVPDLRHGELGRRCVGLVFEMRHRSTTAVVSDGSD